MNYKIKKAFSWYKQGEEVKIFPDAKGLESHVLALLEHCGFIEPITEWSADKLEEGDEYYYMDDMGAIYGDCWDNEKMDHFRLKSKNIYRTKEEAEEAYKRIMNS